MTEKSDLTDLFKNLNLDAIGRQVTRALVEWLSNPEVMRLLEVIHGRTSAAGVARAEPKAVCSKEGCDEPVRAKGLCAKHYQRQRYAKKRMDNPRTSGRGFGECSQEGCTNRVHARGMCGAHFMEWVRAKRKAEEES